jgi:hypothetical protein
MADLANRGAEEKIGHSGRDDSAGKTLKQENARATAYSTPLRAGRNGCATKLSWVVGFKP